MQCSGSYSLSGGEKSLTEDYSVAGEISQEDIASSIVTTGIVSPEGNSEGALETTILSPATLVDCEKKISEIWCNVLGVSDIGINDNFFELGGNSLLAVRIVKDIKKVLTGNISVTQLFQYPTISSLAADLTEGANDLSKTENFEDRAKMRRNAITMRRRQAVDN